MSENSVHPLEYYEKLGEIELGRGDVISTIDLASFPGDYPVYSSSAVGAGEFGRYGRFMFDEELITWSIDGGGRPFYRPKHRYSVTNVCGYLRIKKADSWNYRYLHALLENLQSGIQFDYQMKAHPSVIRELYRFGRMPIEEQQAIGEILDTLDTAIHETEAIIAKLKAVKQGLLHDLLTRGIAANGELRPPQAEAPHLYQQSPLGWIPKEWEVSTVGEQFEIQLGKMLDGQKNAGILKPYLGNKAVQWDRIDLGEVQQVRLSKSDLIRFRLQKGDLLVCEGGDVGRAAIWENDLDECYYQKALHRLRPLCSYHPRLMLEIFRYLMGRDALSEYVSRTSIAHLTQEKLAAVPLPTPKIDEQERMVAEILTAKQRLETEESQLQKLRLLKSALMDDLLTGRVRVTPLLEAAAP